MDALWEIQKVMDNKNNRLVIGVNGADGRAGDIITGFATSDTFSLATSSSYSDIADTVGAAVSDVLGALPWGEKLLAGVQALSSLGNLAAAGAGIGKTVAGSIQKWDGSVSQVPPIQLLFVALRPDDRPQDNAAKLLSLCMPGEPQFNNNHVSISDVDLFFWAPNGYSPYKVAKSLASERLGYSGKHIEGTCSVQIGRWFEASGLLPESASFEVSKETTKKGNPLYVTGTITFKTYRDMKAKEYQKQFLQF